MISGHNPWRRAVLTDDCFRSYVNNPGFFRDMLPISLSADAILRKIFTNESSRVSLGKLRRLILEVDTFFMSDEEIARSSNFVKTAAEAYLCVSSGQSSLDAGPVEEDAEVTWYQEKVADWSGKEGLEEVSLSSGMLRPQKPAAMHPPRGVHSHPTTLVSSVQSDIESHRTRGILKRPLPPPQPMPSSSSLLHPSAGSTTSPSSSRSTSRSPSRRMCGSDSPAGLLRRLMERIFV